MHQIWEQAVHICFKLKVGEKTRKLVESSLLLCIPIRLFVQLFFYHFPVESEQEKSSTLPLFCLLNSLTFLRIYPSSSSSSIFAIHPHLISVYTLYLYYSMSMSSSEEEKLEMKYLLLLNEEIFSFAHPKHVPEISGGKNEMTTTKKLC